MVGTAEITLCHFGDALLTAPAGTAAEVVMQQLVKITKASATGSELRRQGAYSNYTEAVLVEGAFEFSPGGFVEVQIHQTGATPARERPHLQASRQDEEKEINILSVTGDGDLVTKLVRLDPTMDQVIRSLFGGLTPCEWSADGTLSAGDQLFLRYQDLADGGLYQANWGLGDRISNLQGSRQTYVASMQRAAGQRCVLILEDTSGGPATALTHTRPIFWEGQKWIQIDAGAIASNRALIGSGKMRLSPGDVSDLRQQLLLIQEGVERGIPQLQQFKNLELSGALLALALPKDEGAIAELDKEAAANNFAVCLLDKMNTNRGRVPRCREITAPADDGEAAPAVTPAPAQEHPGMQ
ncbi:hypothetical protein WJX73_002156 [Symbiochloris irregularis]|uniref:Uncharacterized protein n=1 Tax=Symbiochloris irregularis TaxID=706552 RepID=A0AAW1Q3J2_9CHLO